MLKESAASLFIFLFFIFPTEFFLLRKIVMAIIVVEIRNKELRENRTRRRKRQKGEVSRYYHSILRDHVF